MRSSFLAVSKRAVVALAWVAAAACSGTKEPATPDAGAPDAPPGMGLPQCSDHVDNDGDGKIDFPNDPGCLNANQDTELDDCPDGPNCPQCGNGKDDDGDGKVDFPADSDCASASDTTEKGVKVGACGDVPIQLMPTTGVATGNIVVGPSHMFSNCGGLGTEVAYEVDVTAPITLTATTDAGGSTADTVIYLRAAACTDADMEIACNDNATTSSTGSTFTADLVPGTYYVIIDDASSTETGTYELHLTTYPGQGVACDAQHPCAPGHFCRPAPGATADTCQPPRCGDGYDNDSDGKTDYPNDPGCASKADDDEADHCPDGADCPACGNGKDDDGDGKIDYPADPECLSASQPAESCGVEQDPLIALPSTGDASGDTSANHDDFSPACTSGSGGLDAVVFFEVPALDSLTIDTVGSSFYTVLALYGATCGGTELGCANDFDTTTKLDLGHLAAGSYAVVVDGDDSTQSGAFQLHVKGVVSAGGRCDGALFAAGALTCASGTACDGTTCKGTLQCNDGVDSDGDGKVDFPDDPGCDSASDDSEADDCPSGPSCPACANGQDDDGDGKTDYPADPDCKAASGTTEQCGVEHDPIGQITGAIATGDTTGDHADWTLSCAYEPSPDAVYMVTVPQLDSLTLSTAGSSFDTVVALSNAACSGELGCNDQEASGIDTSRLDTGPLAAGAYAIIVAGFDSTLSGPYQLTVSGVISTGASCTSPLVAANVLACAAGSVCDGSVCKGVVACNDGVDSDGDGKVDYPADPGCASPTDNDETDDCPSGPNCPACGNGQDDDGDGTTDFPADLSCTSASGTSESCASADPILTVVGSIVAGTNSGAHNDFNPACAGTTSAPDQLYQLDVPAMATLTVDMSINDFDEVIEVLDGTCGGTPLDCQDSGTIDLTNVAAGRYFVVADGFDTSSIGTYVLKVSGTIASGGACEGILATTGAITCTPGTTCKGSAGSKVCAP